MICMNLKIRPGAIYLRRQWGSLTLKCLVFSGNLLFYCFDMDGPIEGYIDRFQDPAKGRMQELLACCRKWFPHASESLKYGIPTFSDKQNLVHFAGYERHIGFYPGPSVLAAHKDLIASFTHSKGAVQFPHHLPLPWDLIRKLVSSRAIEAGLPDLTGS